MKNSLSALICSFIFALSACAPSLGVHITVPGLPEQNSSGQDDAQRAVDRVPLGSAGKARVASFMDARSSSAVVVIDGREIVADGPLGGIVQEGFERYLRDAGVRVVLSGAPVIEGEIVEWRSKITPKFPATEASAIARIKINVRDPRTQFVAFRGTFSGESTMTDPFVTEHEVQKLLTDAMSTAIQAAIKEDAFKAQLLAVQ